MKIFNKYACATVTIRVLNRCLNFTWRDYIAFYIFYKGYPSPPAEVVPQNSFK